MKPTSSRFDRLVARYYPAVYSFASRLTDDPRKAVALTRDAFNSTRKQVRNPRDENVFASMLISRVIRVALITPLEPNSRPVSDYDTTHGSELLRNYPNRESPREILGKNR
jgi:DNA-directed RNA polymerase specialized sigma24 family protein